MTSLLLIANGALGVMVSFLAAGFSVSEDPWPACYIFFPTMEFAGSPGFLVAPAIFFLLIAVAVLIIRAAISPTPKRRKAALILAHVFLAVVFFVPAVFEAFGEYIGP